MNDSLKVKAGDNTYIHHTKLDIAPKALVRIACAIAIVVLLLKMFQFMMVFLLGLMLAISFEPIVERMTKYRLNRKAGIALIALAIIGIIVLFSYIIIPSIYDQLSQLIKDFPQIKADFLAGIPQGSVLKKSADQALNAPKMPEISTVVTTAFPYLNIGFEAIAQTVLVFIFSIYLLIDGKRTFNWFSAFFDAPTRMKLRKTARETAPIVHHYILGQIVTSVASAIYTFGALTLLQVPAALTLACLAGVLDILPVLGFIIAVIPAILLGLTVSPLTGLIVLAAYILYHAIESYLLVPLIYGNTLKVSSLVVLTSLIIAASVGGVLFAIIILPIVASYPIFERIWLARYLGQDVIYKHEKQPEIDPLDAQVTMWEENCALKSRPVGGLISPKVRRTLKRKIIVLEGNSDIRAVLQDILESEGYEVVAARDQEGVQNLMTTNPDIGLMILDGSASFPSDQISKKLPVIYLTNNEKFKPADNLGTVLVKPASLDVLLNTIERIYG